ncbi:MAG: phage holin family protein [Patescibacteria group bacterium]
MRLLAKLVLIIAANAAAIWAATQYIAGVNFEGGIRELAAAAAILTVLNFILKPLLKLILGPIIILTLGLGLILINAIVIYILDIFSANLMIDGIPALFYATILISAVNFVVHIATKR